MVKRSTVICLGVVRTLYSVSSGCTKGAAVCAAQPGVRGLWAVGREVGIRSVVPLGVYVFSEISG